MLDVGSVTCLKCDTFGGLQVNEVANLHVMYSQAIMENKDLEILDQE